MRIIDLPLTYIENVMRIIDFPLRVSVKCFYSIISVLAGVFSSDQVSCSALEKSQNYADLNPTHVCTSPHF